MTEINVVIVEDEDLYLDDIERRLKKFGYNPMKKIKTGEDAIPFV